MFHVSFETSGLLPTWRTAGYEHLRVDPRSRDVAWYWHLLEAELRERGHEAVAVDLLAAEDSAGLWEYANAVVGAIGDHTDLVLMAQSFGGFTALLVRERVPVDLLVMLNAMVPSPGETPRNWWSNTGRARARPEQAERDGSEVPAVEDLRDAFSTTSRPRSRLGRG